MGLGRSHDPEVYRFISLLSNYKGYELVGHVSSHNSFLNVGISTGVLGLSMSLAVYGYLLRLMIRRFKKARNRYYLYFYASSISFFVGYFFQSSSHNGGLFSGDIIAWLVIGLILTSGRLKDTGALLMR